MITIDQIHYSSREHNLLFKHTSGGGLHIFLVEDFRGKKLHQEIINQTIQKPVPLPLSFKAWADRYIKDHTNK